jgi:exopolysaccharide biosynthesis polyprenyl glycosylphosphotransferase
MFQRKLKVKRSMEQGIATTDPSVSVQQDCDRSADFIKRLLDLLIASTLVAFTLPLMMIVGSAIKCDSPGPVFYRQERVGLNSRRFVMLKFRSMRQDAEAHGQPVWAAARDDRITRVGGFIRRTRIDELPQLLNVLHGDMSLVGPRPERPYFVDQLGKLIPSYGERHAVLPGITGWAQVKYSYGASVEDARQKLAYDLYYIANRSLLLDLRILLETVGVVIFQKGAR